MAEEQKKTTPVAAKPPLDPDNVTLSAERLEAIRLKAREMVAKERLEALEKLELERALEEIRGKVGNLTGDPVEDEIVNITIDVAAHSDSITINGRKFFHGQTYSVPRHQARSLMEIMYRTALHEHSITDKPLAQFYAKPRHTIISRRGAVNAPRRPGEGLPAGVA